MKYKNLLMYSFVLIFVIEQLVNIGSFRINLANLYYRNDIIYNLTFQQDNIHKQSGVNSYIDLNNAKVKLLDSIWLSIPKNKKGLITLLNISKYAKYILESNLPFIELKDETFKRQYEYSLVLYLLYLEHKDSEAISFYENIPFVFRNMEQDSIIALINLTLAQEYLVSEDSAKLEKILHEVLRYQPANLNANYYLRELTERKHLASNIYNDKLEKVDIDQIVPNFDEMVIFNLMVIPFLYEDNTWDLSTTQQVMSTLIWQYSDIGDIENILKQFLNNSSTDEEKYIWTKLLVEYYIRNKSYDKLYDNNVILDIADHDNAQEIFNYCMIYPNICAVSLNDLQIKIEINNNDLWMNVQKRCEKLSETGIKCGKMDKGNLNEGLSSQKEVKRINIFSNPRFEIWDNIQKPSDWGIQSLNYGPGEGTFFGGRDEVDGNENLVRLTYIWGIEPYSSIALIPTKPSSFVLDENKKYLLEINYMTEASSNPRVSLWSPDSLPLCYQSKKSPEFSLPNTDGLWMNVKIPLCLEGNKNVEIRPAIRLWSHGSIWVDSIYLYEE